MKLNLFRTRRMSSRKPLTKNRALELLFENGVRVVAFLSITVIVAIFYFIVKESWHAFEEVPTVLTQTLTAGELDEGADVPQVYPRQDDGDTASVGEKDLAPHPSLFREMMPVTSSPPLHLSDLFAANDTVNGQAAYIWQPASKNARFSLIPLLAGSLKVSAIAMGIAAPVALLAAIFTVVYAPRRMQQILKPTIEIMAGFPTVVIGFFALTVLAGLIQQWTDSDYRLNAFVAGVGLSIAVIPIIYTIVEDALTSVPRSIHEGGLALGATRWQTAWRVLVPAALPGVLAGLMLGFGRAFGETMIALMASGNAPIVSGDLFQSVRTMAATIGAEMAETEFRGIHYGVLFFIGAALFFITFAINAFVELLVRKMVIRRRKF